VVAGAGLIVFGAQALASVVEGLPFVRLELEPGSTAVSYAAWDATDGRTTLDTLYVAPFAGAERTVVTLERAWDLTAASVVAVTAWQEA
jgi:hypothetical protein